MGRACYCQLILIRIVLQKVIDYDILVPKYNSRFVQPSVQKVQYTKKIPI